MTAIELANLVADMRRAQKAYFRTKSTGALEESKRLEKRLDQAVEELLRQPTLFDRMES
jgi:hypothetical protein